jgi:hypothetical protein
MADSASNDVTLTLPCPSGFVYDFMEKDGIGMKKK